MGTSNERFLNELNRIKEQKNCEAMEALLQKNSDTRADKTIYIGDGLTDYYAMKYIHNNGGKTIFVHQNESDLDIYKEVNKENIVDYCEIADYDEKTDLYKAIMKGIKS